MSQLKGGHVGDGDPFSVVGSERSSGPAKFAVS
jgi:hypothetical protein